MELLEVSINTAKQLAETALQANIPVMFHGSPGNAKSAIVKSLANKYNLKLIDIRLAQKDPTELSGFPSTYNADKTGKATYLPMDTFPLEGEELPINPKTKKPYAGFLIFFDELGNAPNLTQGAAYEPILDRTVGGKPLHPNTRVMAATNYVSDKAAANRIGSALMSRLMNVYVKLSADDFQEYMNQKGFNKYIRAFLAYKPSAIFTMDPKSNETFACGRTWEMLNNYMNQLDEVSTGSYTQRYAYSGIIGSNIGTEFFGFTQIFNELPTIDEIIKEPTTTKIPSDPQVGFALAAHLSEYVNKDNLDMVSPFLDRMSPEFKYFLLKGVVSKDVGLIKHPYIKPYIKNLARDVYE